MHTYYVQHIHWSSARSLLFWVNKEKRVSTVKLKKGWQENAENNMGASAAAD